MATYHTAKTGNDGNSGVDLANAFLTIARGLTALSPGDTLLVHVGTYVESFINTVPGGTSWSVPVIVKGVTGEIVTVRPASGGFVVLMDGSASKFIQLENLIIDAVNCTNAIKVILPATRVRILNCEIKNSQFFGVQSEGGNEFIGCRVHHCGQSAAGEQLYHAIYPAGAGDLIDGCEFDHQTGGYGVHLFNNTSGTVNDNIVRNCRVHDNDRGGFVVASGSRNQIYNNLIYNHPGVMGIQVSYSVFDTKIYHNTIVANSTGIHIIAENGGVINTDIKNNIFRGNSVDVRDFGTGTVMDHNVFGSTDPQFVSSTDFHLQAASPCIGVGVATFVANDLDGVPRANPPTIGAYEFVGTGRRIYYAAPNGGGNGASPSTPATLSTLWSVLNPGDTIFLLDGVYTGANNLLKPPPGLNGQPGAYITVIAKNDGGALFDGQFATIVVSLSNNSWWILQGFDVRHGEVEVLRIGEQSNNVIVRRVVVWDAWIHGNTTVCGVHFVNGPVLFEDVACFGTGRKTLGPTQDVGVANGTTGFTCRRCWSRFDGSISTGPSGASMSYNTWNMIYENLLARFSATQMPASYTVLDSWPPHNIYPTPIQCGPGGTGQCPGTGQIFGFKWAAGFERQDRDFATNGKLLGSLAYVLKDDPLWFNHAWGHAGQALGGLSNVTIENVYGFIHPQNARFNSADGFSRAGSYEDPFGGGVNLDVDRVTHVGGFHAHPAWNITNNFSGNLAAAVPNPWTTSTGANLCKRYVDGAPTATPLWPWPMNDRIKRATEIAGRYSGPCPGCSGGFVERTATDVTAEIESILGPIPSACSSSVGSPPATGGSARGVSGVDVVNKSEFVALDSGLRLINVSDTDHPTERVRFPFTIAANPADPSEAANRGHALTWLVDASQVTGTGLAPADLRYADIDVEVLDPTYQARITEDPTVSRELMDTFWGVTEVSSISVTLANADGRLTPLFVADPRDQTIILRRLDYRSGQLIDELYARITNVALGNGTVILSATTPDLSILEREIPATLVTREAYPNAVDVGAVIPVVFGQVPKLPLPYVKETATTFEYLAGHGTVTVSALYYIRGDNTYTKIPVDEYEVSTTLYPGYTAVRFATRRMDITTGSLLAIVADVEGPIRHFVRAIEALLVGPNAWGLNGAAGPINTAAFNQAAADLDQVGLFCDGAIREQRQVQDVLRDLMVVRGIRLAFTSNGEWTITVDTQRTSGAISIADGLGDGGRTILSAGQRERPTLNDAISIYRLRYRPEYVRGVYLNTRERTVNASFGRDRTIENPFIRDHATADKVVDYLARRERFGAERVAMTITQEGRALLEGDLVEVTYPSLQYDRDVLEVRKATKRLQSIDLDLASWSDEIYVYGPETLPTDVVTDETDGTIPAPLNIQGQAVDCAMVITWNHVTP